MAKDPKPLNCITGYKYDIKKKLCLKQTNEPPKFIEDKPPPTMLPIFFGELSSMINLAAYKSE
jgi:hypothetical protein